MNLELNSGANATEDRDAEREALITELQRVYQRLEGGSTSTTTVISFIFVIFAGGIVAAKQIPEAFVVIPIFWSAWVLYILTADRDSVKYGQYARYLERRLRVYFNQPIFVWESRVNRSATGRPYLVAFTYAYWCLPGVIAWIITVVVFIRLHEPWYALAAGAVGSAVWVTALFAVKSRSTFADSWERVFIDAEGSSIDALN